MRGSSAVCTTSTVRFSATKNSASTKMVPSSSGRSALEDRRVEQESGAGPGKHRLYQDRTPEQIAELQAHHRERSREPPRIQSA
jgi:hypothetical protein